MPASRAGLRYYKKEYEQACQQSDDALPAEALRCCSPVATHAVTETLSDANRCHSTITQEGVSNKIHFSFVFVTFHSSIRTILTGRAEAARGGSICARLRILTERGLR